MGKRKKWEKYEEDGITKERMEIERKDGDTEERIGKGERRRIWSREWEKGGENGEKKVRMGKGG